MSVLYIFIRFTEGSIKYCPYTYILIYMIQNLNLPQWHFDVNLNVRLYDCWLMYSKWDKTRHVLVWPARHVLCDLTHLYKYTLPCHFRLAPDGSERAHTRCMGSEHSFTASWPHTLLANSTHCWLNKSIKIHKTLCVILIKIVCIGKHIMHCYHDLEKAALLFGL